MSPFFSIIIPLYNKENYIEKTLRSVLAQSFSDIEIIIVNDGSTDQSMKKAREINDDRIVLIEQENQGVSTARNRGIEIAKGKYIALLDADDYWYPDHLEELKALISEFPEAGLYCTGYEIYMGNGLTKNAVYTFAHGRKKQIVDDYFAASTIDPIAWTSAVAFSRDDFYTIGIFDTRLRTAQDLDFFIRAALKLPVAFSPKITMRYHKQSENNLAKSHYNEDRVLFLSLYQEEEKNNPSLKKYLDINRYAVTLRCKIRNDKTWKKLIREINSKNLNWKQRFLLKMPKTILQAAIRSQRVLMKFGIYFTAFK